MFTSSDYARMYELMAARKVTGDGPEPQALCCRGQGVFLFPGEREHLAATVDESRYQLTFEADVSDPFKVAGMQWIFHCLDCAPEVQPLGARLWPTLAYIEDWTYRGVILDRRLFYPVDCELCDDPEVLSQDFLRAAYGVWAWLCTDPKVASILAIISEHARAEALDGYWRIDAADQLFWHPRPAPSRGERGGDGEDEDVQAPA